MIGRGQRLGSYELVARIGEGGMGEVWQGAHVHLARTAAIKLIRPATLARDGDSTDVLKRFQREAQATSALRSPHTVELYDFGVTPEGVFYYAMELLEGCSLQQLIDATGPVPPERAVAILLQVCESLAEAHEIGLVHRDIKPANIFLARLGKRTDFVKLLDFGLVKFDAASAPGATQLTADDVAQGTPTYMPPEVVHGSAHFDARSDIYALGCVAYWLITGDLVFRVETPLEIVMAHVHDTPVPPSQRLGAPVPDALEALILACLQKDPAARPPSVEEVAARLAAVPLPAPWTESRSADWWDAHQPSSWSGTSLPAPSTLPATLAPPAPRAAFPWAAVVALAVAVPAVVFAVLAFTRAPTPRPPPPPEAEGPPVTQPAPSPEPPGSDPPTEAQAPEAPAPAPRPAAAPAPDPPAGILVSVTLNSRPWSKLTIDGEAVGRTRWEGALPPGPHEVRFEATDGTADLVTVTVPAEEGFVFCWNLELGAPCRR